MLRLMYPGMTPLKAGLVLLALVVCAVFGGPVDTLGETLYSIAPALAIALAYGGVKAAQGIGSFLHKKFDPTEIQKRAIGKKALGQIQSGQFKGLGRGKLEGLAATAARVRLAGTKAIEAGLRRGAAAIRGGGTEIKKLGQLFKARQMGAAQTIGQIGAADVAATASQRAAAMKLAGMAGEPDPSEMIGGIAEGVKTGGTAYAGVKKAEMDKARLRAYRQAQGLEEDATLKPAE